MKQRVTRIGRTAGLHLRRQAIGYVALAVALTGSAYAGSKGGSGKVGADDLRPVVVREGQSITAPPGQSTGGIEATCQPGERAVAPGITSATGGGGGTVLKSIGVTGEPVKEGSARIRPTGMLYFAANTSSEPLPITAEVACLRP